MEPVNDPYTFLRHRPFPNLLSLVIPIYNEESAIEVLRTEVDRFVHNLCGQCEVILVNDGSSDGTRQKIVAWAAEDRRIKVLDLSRNFGRQIAATAGLDYAAGDAVVLIDADLRDPLPVIHQMIDRYCEGYDVVYGEREARLGESRCKLFLAGLFCRLAGFLFYQHLPIDTGDFRLISRECLNALKLMRDVHRFLRGMVASAGYPRFALKYQRAAPVAGRTKHRLRKILAFAWTRATSFSSVPLQVSLVFGLIMGLFGLAEATRAFLAWLLGWYPVPGWTSLMIMDSLLGSMLLLSIGILGRYIGLVYEQSRDRPLYIISESFNLQDRDSRREIGTAA